MNELEKAAREYCDSVLKVTGHYSDPENAFQIGALWQAKQSPWISVEGMPPPNLHKNVLLKVENSGVFVGLGLNVKETDLKITHWMPIPE